MQFQTRDMYSGILLSSKTPPCLCLITRSFFICTISVDLKLRVGCVNMFVLVKFDNLSTGIYTIKNVIIKENNMCIVKHKGATYSATYLRMHGKLLTYS